MAPEVLPRLTIAEYNTMMRALSALTLTSRAMSARALAPELTRTALAPTVTLASGYEMPVVALGTWKAPAGQTGAAVEVCSLKITSTNQTRRFI